MRALQRFKGLIRLSAGPAALFATLLLCMPAWAAGSKARYDIPPQSLASALKALAAAGDLQLVFSPEVVAGLKTRGVKGDYTALEALDRLIAQSGLTYSFDGKNTIVVRRMSTAAKDEVWRVANAGKTEASSNKGRDDVEEMLVEGERDKPAPFSTANLDLTRTEDDALPFTVFTARDIELSGAASLAEFLRNRLTQNFNPRIPEEEDGANYKMVSGESSRANQINFRYWGAAETVILLNGRRLPAEYQGSGNDADNATPSLQGIPLGSIERIEILSSAGSAIYGTGATAGVINIITRRDYHGGQLFVNYETPADVHRPRRGIGMSYGLPFKWETNLRVAAGYDQSEPLRAGDRADVTIVRWRRLAMERSPEMLYDTYGYVPPEEVAPSLFFGATPNIASAVYLGDPDAVFGYRNESLFGPGTATFATVRPGHAGGGGLSGFEPGVYNEDLAEGSAGNQMYARNSRLGPVSENATFNLGADKRFGERWRWSVDYRYSQNDNEGQLGGAREFQYDPGSLSPFIPAGAAINPFSRDVRVFLVDPRLDRPELTNRSTNVSWGLSSTLHATFGEWQTFFDAGYSHNRNRYALSQFHEPAGGWDQAFIDGRYNPFVDVRTVAPATPDFYDDYIAYREFYGSATRNYQSALRASGPAWRLPGGAVELTVGADWDRAHRYKRTVFRQYQDGLTGEPRIPECCSSADVTDLPSVKQTQFTYNTYAAYTEANVPAVGGAQQVPLVNRLELFGSARVSRQEVNGFDGDDRPVDFSTEPYVYVLGLRYEMLPGVSWRATRSIGFRPPSLEEITPSDPPVSGDTTTVFDPRRMQEVELDYTQFIYGGNLDLKPETSDATNIGLILTPGWTRGLRFSIDYVEIIRDDAIAGIDPGLVVELEAELPGRVQRGAPNGHPSGVGPIIFVDAKNINFRQIISRGLDLSFEQQYRNILGGRLLLAGAASRNLSFKRQTSNTAPPREQVGVGSTIRWNANLQLRWEGRNWGFGWNTRYYDRFLITQSYLATLQGGTRIPWKLDHDLNVNYRSTAPEQARGLRSLLSGASLTFGIKNVFDREPRFWADTNSSVAPYDSIVGRSVWLQLRKDFQ